MEEENKFKLKLFRLIAGAKTVGSLNIYLTIFCLCAIIICSVMPALLLYFLGYVETTNSNNESISNTCQVTGTLTMKQAVCATRAASAVHVIGIAIMDILV
jgi:hypothetical protein